MSQDIITEVFLRADFIVQTKIMRISKTIYNAVTFGMPNTSLLWIYDNASKEIFLDATYNSPQMEYNIFTKYITIVNRGTYLLKWYGDDKFGLIIKTAYEPLIAHMNAFIEYTGAHH